MAERTSRRATGVVAAYWSAASSGRFFTWWSAAASFAVASIILVPVQDGGGAAAYGRSVVAAAIGWMILAVPVAGVAMLERRLSGALARGVLITITLVAISVARTFVNSAVLSARFGDLSTGPIVTRVLTNLLAAFALFPVVAIITEGRRRTRAITERLAAALDRLDAATAVAADRAREATAFVTRIEHEVRAGRDATLAGTVDFDTVRAFSERVRSASHALEEQAASAERAPALADAGAPALAADTPPDAGASAVALPTVRRRALRLAPTPFLWAGILYAVLCVPFVVSLSGNILGATVATAAIIVIDLVANAVLRKVPERVLPAAFFIVWLLAGAGAAAIAHLLLPEHGPLMYVPAVALPAVAIVLALALDAHRSVSEEEERSTRELAEAAADFAVESARAPEQLRHAASMLHGRIQGRCVIFAALADEHPPTADDIARFRDETDTALDELLPAHDTPPTGGFDRMLAGWRPLMDLDTRIADAAASAIAQAGDGSVLTEVVNEALVNAVKHSGARAARIEITMGDSGEMFVRVAAPGRLPRAVMQTRSFTGRTLLFQDGDDVVLEAAVPATGATVNA